MTDKVLKQDIEKIAQNKELAELLKGKSVFITGATGLLGRQAVFALAEMNRIYGNHIQITAMVRSEEKAKAVFGELLENEEISLYYGDINNKIEAEQKINYIIHGASATSSKYFVDYPVETIMTAIQGTKNILEFAKENQAEGMVYLSSLEVYGTPNGQKEWIKEDDYGYINPLSVRSSYSEGKRMVECLCASYAKEFNVPVKIARLSQTFGAGADYNDGRVFAEFARCAVEKRDIVLHTKGNTIRTYCYTKDAVEALLYIMLKGTAGEAYNVTNMDTAVSIREMAELVCTLYPENKLQVKFDIPKDASGFGYNPEMIIRLDCHKTEALGWKAETGLKEMFERMIESGFRK